MKGNKTIIVFVILFLAITAYYAGPILRENFFAQDGGEQENDTLYIENWAIYNSSKFGFRFSYPKKYFLEERELGDGHRYHYNITLTEDTEENRLVREGKSPGREGPVAITIDLYQNNLDNYTADGWIKGTNNSNYKLSPDGTLDEVTVSGILGLRYRWSGLYEADNIVIARPDNVYSFAVTYIFPDEAIRTDFERILKTFEFLSSE